LGYLNFAETGIPAMENDSKAFNNNASKNPQNGRQNRASEAFANIVQFRSRRM
jgi:hypothetical protein